MKLRQDGVFKLRFGTEVEVDWMEWRALMSSIDAEPGPKD